MIWRVLVLATFLWPTACFADSGYDHWAKGKEALDLGNRKIAASLFERAVRTEPKDSIYRNWLGSVYFDLGLYKDASRQLTKAVEYDKEAAWYYFLGKSHLELAWQSKNELEAEEFRIAAETSFKKGIQLARKKKWLVEMKKAMPILPDLTERKRHITQLQKMKKFTKAIAELDRLILHYPFNGIDNERRQLEQARDAHKRQRELHYKYAATASAMALVLLLVLWKRTKLN